MIKPLLPVMFCSMFSINWSVCSAALLKDLLNNYIVTGLYILDATTQNYGEADICKISGVHFVAYVSFRSVCN